LSGAFSSRKALAAILVVAAAGAWWLFLHRGGPPSRTFKIGWENDPPFQVTLADGRPGGLAVELVQEAARRRNIQLEWVWRPRSSETSLTGGQNDLWPLITITPERQKRIHISEPYIEHEFYFLVRQSSRYQRAHDLDRAAIGHINQPIAARALTKEFPNARLVALTSAEAVVEEVCSGRVDGAYLEENSAVGTLLDGVACHGEPLRLISIPSIRSYLGVGATFEAADVADEIRDEIGAIAEEGQLPAMVSRWGDYAARNTETIFSLAAAHSQERRLRTAIFVFAALLLVALWLTIRLSRETRRTRRAQETLRQTEQKLRLMANNLSEVVFAYDMARKLTYANPAAERFTGYSIADLEKQGWRAWTHADDLERCDRLWELLFQGEAVRDEEFRMVGRDGQTKWVLANCGPILDETGSQVGVQGSLQDITERKIAESERARLQAQVLQAQKMESVGRLAGGVAHDFNNLLTVINGYSSMLLDRMTADDPTRGKIAEIRKAGESAAALVRQLLAFSRKQVLQRERLDLNAMLGEMHNMLLLLMGERIEVVLRLAPVLEDLYVDRHQIEQVLLNLAINARDAMPQGGVLTIETGQEFLAGSVCPRCGAEVQPGAYVCVSVTDTGTGMDDNVREHLFEPFFTTKEVGQGTGLGLATAHGIVTQSGGHIDVESIAGKGASFRVVFPVAGAVEDNAIAADGSSTAKRETILLVEDQAEVRKFTADLLRDCGYQVIEASAGEEALARSTREHIDLLLTDMVMPGLNGTELATRIRVNQPSVKILFMSGYSNKLPVKYDGSDAAVIQKPFGRAVLVSTIQEVLKP
jgi:PAS domain S-box-containing protein